MGTAAGCSEDQGLGCSFIFPPMESKLVKNTTKKREGERGGEGTSHWIFHEWFLSEEKEHLCLWRVQGGDTAKAGCDHRVLGTQGRVQGPIPGVKSNLCCNNLRLQLKRTLPLPSALSACSCLLYTCEAPVIPRGFGSEVQWVWMLSTLKIKHFLLQNDEKPMTAPLVHVSDKGCWVARQVHVPVHMGLTITWGHPRVPPEPMRSFSFFFFCWGFLTSLRGTWGWQELERWSREGQRDWSSWRC